MNIVNIYISPFLRFSRFFRIAERHIKLSQLIVYFDPNWLAMIPATVIAVSLPTGHLVPSKVFEAAFTDDVAFWQPLSSTGARQVYFGAD